MELKLFDGPNGGCIVQPRVLARTTNIERGIVTCDDGRITIIPPVAGATAAGSSGTRMTITKERYLEQLERNFPGIAEKLNAFISKLEMCAVLPEFGINSMILRWHAETKSWNLGTIPSSGQVFTDQLGAFNAGLPDADKKYVENLAALVPGAVVEPSKKKTAWGAYKDHKTISIDALLADEAREDGWLHAIAEFQEAVAKLSQGEVTEDQMRHRRTCVHCNQINLPTDHPRIGSKALPTMLGSQSGAHSLRIIFGTTRGMSGRSTFLAFHRRSDRNALQPIHRAPGTAVDPAEFSHPIEPEGLR